MIDEVRVKELVSQELTGLLESFKREHHYPRGTHNLVAETIDIDDLADVTAPSPSENDVLYWSGTAWVPNATAVPGSHATEHEVAGSDLVDHDALTNFVAGEHLVVGSIDHDALLNFVANEHLPGIDEDDMASDSAVHVPTQQSVKAYVDGCPYYATYVAPGTDTLSTAVAAMSNGDCLILGVGTYTQTVATPIPTSVVRFMILGQGIGSTIIDVTSDVAGFSNTKGTDAYRIQRAKMVGFTMQMSAASTDKTAIAIWGDSSNRTISPSITLQDIAVFRTDTTKYWGIGFDLINCYNPQILNCYVRTYKSGATCYGTGIKLQSCVNGLVQGGEYFELNKAWELVKATDADIYGASKHGVQGIVFDTVHCVAVNYGFYMEGDSLAIRADSCTVDFVINSGWYEADNDGAGGYHNIVGGWWSFDTTNGVADSYMIYIRNAGTRVTAPGLTGDGTIDFNGVGVLDDDADRVNVIGCNIRSMEWAINIQGDSCVVGSNNISDPQHADYDIYIHANADGTNLQGNSLTKGIDDNGTNTVTCMNGKVVRDAWIPASGIREPGTKPATWKEWGISGVWEFSDATDDTLVANIKFPNDMDMTVAPSVSVGWSTNTAVTSETARWQLEYLYTAPGENTIANAQATIYVDSDAVAQANGLIVVTFPAMAVPGATDVCVHMRIKRLGAVDDLTDTAELHGLCMSYTSNKRGTAT